MAFTPEHFVAWTEIPVSDIDKSMAFYRSVMDIEFMIEEAPDKKMATFKTNTPMMGVSGHLYEGKPAKDGSGPTIHLHVPGTLEDAMDRVTEAGGKLVSEPVSIPPGRFAYATDLDGNSIGLFEVAA